MNLIENKHLNSIDICTCPCIYLDWWTFIKLPVTVCCLSISTLYIFTTLNTPAYCCLTARSVLRNHWWAFGGKFHKPNHFILPLLGLWLCFYLLTAWKSLDESLFGIISTWNFLFLVFSFKLRKLFNNYFFFLCWSIWWEGRRKEKNSKGKYVSLVKFIFPSFKKILSQAWYLKVLRLHVHRFFYFILFKLRLSLVKLSILELNICTFVHVYFCWYSFSFCPPVFSSILCVFFQFLENLRWLF